MSSGSASRGLAGRQCLVTGASGYLGRQLIPRLASEGLIVTALVRARQQEALLTALGASEIVVGDLGDAHWAAGHCEPWRWDDIVHLAGTVPGRPVGAVAEAEAARTHEQFSRNLERAIPRSWPGRLIVSSSMTVYGVPESIPVSERAPLRPRFAYALGKLRSEEIWRASDVSDYWLLRLPGLFSSDRRSGALYHFVVAGLAGKPIELTASRPTPWEVLHVQDAVEAIVRVLRVVQPQRGAMNLGYGENVELESVARQISSLTTGAAVANCTGVSHPPFQLDISCSRQVLNWPPCSLATRLAELVEELRAK